MAEGIKKIRKGLVLLIEGMLEDAVELSSLNSESKDVSIKNVLNYRIDEIKKYIEKADTYNLPKEKLEPLKIRYNAIKHLKSK